MDFQEGALEGGCRASADGSLEGLEQSAPGAWHF